MALPWMQYKHIFTCMYKYRQPKNSVVRFAGKAGSYTHSVNPVGAGLAGEGAAVSLHRVGMHQHFGLGVLPADRRRCRIA